MDCVRYDEQSIVAESELVCKTLNLIKYIDINFSFEFCVVVFDQIVV
ncbi:hypothetical protein IMCC3135_18555 [Granulosicoccus antarcticus IMCC3135]|uniref:Uncharacterized protein n=1 Tax=Granulosicoccus antarcticus IMCC3135 TaxID=1192854 RepID=A0A2Z2NY70_9GAMM|nr:hypothetical protein IMCC3135_18555 [Granulosicoccus antarcticus IMCC3135]